MGIALVLALLVPQSPSASTIGSKVVDDHGPQYAARRALESTLSLYCVRPSSQLDDSESSGSAVAIDSQGIAVTCAHCVGSIIGNSDLVVRLRGSNNQEYGASIVSVNRELDLAVLLLRGPGCLPRPIEVGATHSASLGDDVLAVGNAYGFEGSVSKGIVAGKNRTILVRDDTGTLRKYSGLLQTDAAINPGNSGGPIVDMAGRMLAMSNAKRRDADNVGFGIPVETIRTVVAGILGDGAGDSWVWFGGMVVVRGEQLVVSEVVPGGPLSRAGVAPGDSIASIDDKPVKSLAEMLLLISDVIGSREVRLSLTSSSGVRAARVVVFRGLEAVVARRTGAELSLVRVSRIAAADRVAVIETVARDSGLLAALEATSVMDVSHVAQGTPAHSLGLKSGDRIVGWFVESSGSKAFVAPEELGQRLVDRRPDATRSVGVLVVRGGEGFYGVMALRL